MAVDERWPVRLQHETIVITIIPLNYATFCKHHCILHGQNYGVDMLHEVPLKLVEYPFSTVFFTPQQLVLGTVPSLNKLAKIDYD